MRASIGIITAKEFVKQPLHFLPPERRIDLYCALTRNRNRYLRAKTLCPAFLFDQITRLKFFKYALHEQLNTGFLCQRRNSFNDDSPAAKPLNFKAAGIKLIQDFLDKNVLLRRQLNRYRDQEPLDSNPIIGF